jgi:hypothetical protein
VPAVVEARHGLLPRIAPLGERDGALDEPRLGGQDAIVDLVPETGCAGCDPQRLEVRLRQQGKVGGRFLIEDLGGRHPVVGVRDPSVHRPEQEIGAMLLELDHGLGREAHAQELVPEGLPELGLREQEVVVGPAPDHAHRRDHARLRGEEQRLAGLAGCQPRDVVRKHALQVVLCVGAADGDEGARARGDRPFHQSQV